MRSTTMIALVGLVLPGCAVADTGLLDLGYRQMYNLEFGPAHETFQQHQREHPDDPMGPVSDAAAWLFAEFDRLHILQAEFFVDDHTFKTRGGLTPDPALKQRFEAGLSQGRKLIGRRLARQPQDRNAMLANILALGLHADYMALIEKRYLPSLREMKDGRLMAERLVAQDPSCYDAYLAIGIENYLLSLRAAPVRWILRMGGAETDRKQGIEMLRVTAEKGRYLRPFARLLLAVAALRDKDRSSARSLLEGLAREFPRNSLYRQELARLR